MKSFLLGRQTVKKMRRERSVWKFKISFSCKIIYIKYIYIYVVFIYRKYNSYLFYTKVIRGDIYIISYIYLFLQFFNIYIFFKNNYLITYWSSFLTRGLCIFTFTTTHTKSPLLKYYLYLSFSITLLYLFT